MLFSLIQNKAHHANHPVALKSKHFNHPSFVILFLVTGAPVMLTPRITSPSSVALMRHANPEEDDLMGHVIKIGSILSIVWPLNGEPLVTQKGSVFLLSTFTNSFTLQS